ncbi:MAG: hypothetical protein ACLR0U_33610 [Enterocloster clostridioformis]
MCGDATFWYMLAGGGIVYLLTMPTFGRDAGSYLYASGSCGYCSCLRGSHWFCGYCTYSADGESKNWVKRILKGLYGAYGVSSYLSDILSYSRLLALGLATSVISTVFNKMGSMMGASIPGAIIFILVFVIGHSLNLAINALGAYVHTNRLQYVEFLESFL